MQFNETKTIGRCPACGKEVVVRSSRDKRPQYCSRVCQGLGRFSTRYRGSMAGPADQPKNLMEKTKFTS